ncbi:hypothetical protein [Natronorubrum daqingense]|uniref:Uncharacterized protein n=1 Tax=Natronorubrum daqingense TaxID=588898 RepID=A0A1N6ZCM3_9EURY|nr:hypothetical protein [Natronorubrum daqingense]APX95390.1 hypothetical protein BB347_01490 [Natronorubrum daqingense]SIR24539.1 hypothetical protein SAMN05421809_0759 [Natronorubrum daqingense]
MSTQHPHTDAQPDRPTQTPEPMAVATTQLTTEHAPRTFSYQNRAQLENLIDEFNAAFANGSST